MNHRPLTFLDIETTGGHAATSRITEIGAIRVENGQAVAHFKQLLNAGQPVPAMITRLTGINTAMLRDAPSFVEIADDLMAFLDGSIFVAHCVNFDYGFIRTAFAREGRKFNMDRLCSVQLDRRLYPAQRRHGLDHVIERLQLEVANRHRAYDDAEVLYRMFQTEYERDPFGLFRQMDKLLVRARTVTTYNGRS